MKRRPKLHPALTPATEDMTAGLRRFLSAPASKPARRIRELRKRPKHARKAA